MKKNVLKKKKSSIIWLLFVAFIAVSLLLFCQFYFGDVVSENTTFFEGTTVNGVDISGMTKSEAENVISSKMLSEKDKINITLLSDDKKWVITGNDLEIVGNFSPALPEVLNYGRDGNIFKKKMTENKTKRDGLNVDIPAEDIYGGIDEKLSNIITEIETKPDLQTILFTPEKTEMFSLNNSGECKIVDTDLLKSQISKAIAQKSDITIEIPTQIIYPQHDLQEFINSISLRGQFSTDFSKSTSDRKSNISLALSKFNGMIIQPGETVSFNQTTGPRTSENGFKSAKIIVGGQYVSGMGGGVCQASTTLYNALLLADIEVVNVFHHTLPASYVPLSFDAMVSEGYADLVFKNNLETPIFIKAYTTEHDVVVEIYGQPLDDGLTIVAKSQLTKVLPHGGDDIIKDLNGEYEDKVLYKGEYYRLKYPLEGYQSKGFIQYYKNGQLINEKEIRNDTYMPQNGIIVEGIYNLEEGMTLPKTSVKYIPPQKITQKTIEMAKTKWKSQ